MKNPVGQITAEWAQAAQLPLWFEPETESTNLIAKNEILSPENPISLVITNHQTKGRGRGSHTWETPSGSSLLSSWIFQMKDSPQPVISPAIGLALYRAAHATWPQLPFSLKAPNDLYLGPHKVAGLLLESIQTENLCRLIVGLGLNVTAKPNLETATCLQEHTSVSKADWFTFLDRLFLETSLAVSSTKNTLGSNDLNALKHALNQFPHLLDAYTEVLPDGGLQTAKKLIPWSDL